MKNLNNFIKMLFAALPLLAFIACSSDDSDSASLPAVQLNKSSIYLQYGGQLSDSLNITSLPSGTPMDSVEVIVGSPSVIKYENGVVTALKEGTSTITFRVKGSKVVTSCYVTVSHIKVTSLTLDKNDVTLLYAADSVSQEIQKVPQTELIATIGPNDAFKKDMTWAVSNDSILTIDSIWTDTIDSTVRSHAIIKSLGNLTTGKTKVTAYSNDDKSVQQVCNIVTSHVQVDTICMRESVTGSSEITIQEGEYRIIEAVLTPTYAKASTADCITFTPDAGIRLQRVANTNNYIIKGNAAGVYYLTVKATFTDKYSKQTIESSSTLKITVKSNEGFKYNSYGDAVTW